MGCTLERIRRTFVVRSAPFEVNLSHANALPLHRTFEADARSSAARGAGAQALVFAVTAAATAASAFANEHTAAAATASTDHKMPAPALLHVLTASRMFKRNHNRSTAPFATTISALAAAAPLPLLPESPTYSTEHKATPQITPAPVPTSATTTITISHPPTAVTSALPSPPVPEPTPIPAPAQSHSPKPPKPKVGGFTSSAQPVPVILDVHSTAPSAGGDRNVMHYVNVFDAAYDEVICCII